MFRLFKIKHRLEDVFTPSSAAILTFVERPDLITQLEKALLIPGMQIVLYGHSGGGKTTLIENILSRKSIQFISSNCMVNTTIDELLLDAFDKLNPFYSSDKQNSTSSTINSEVKSSYLGIKSLIKGEIKKEFHETQKRVLPIQLTPQRLAEFLGAAEIVWKIEDFHKVDVSERQKLSQILKIFVDTANRFKKVKIIAIGAVGTARDIVNYDSELTNRVSEVFVPLMTPQELDSILIKGEKLLSIDFNKNTHKEIIKFSNSLAAICHQLCFSICYNNRVFKTQRHKKILREDKLQPAVIDYLKQNSDSFKETYDRAIRRRDDRKFDNPKLVIEAFCNIQKEELSRTDIGNYKGLKKIFKGELFNFLQCLTTPDYGEILRYDSNSGKYYFSNPFFKAYAIMRLATEDDSRFKPREDFDFERIKILLDIMNKNEKIIFRNIEFK
jgi:hypothetical protein